MSDQSSFSLPRNAIATCALALVAIIGVAWDSGRNPALSADAKPWLGRWVIAAETCENNSYDMLIEPDHFEIWEQGCDIKNWKFDGNLATLTMQCFNEGNSTTNVRLQLMVRGDTIERVGGYDFSPNTMIRCR
jgi:hypothetical protein